MNRQLQVFDNVDKHNFKEGDCVQIGFVMGYDITRQVKRLYTGGNFGYIVSINHFQSKAIVVFPARVEPEFSFIGQELFEFDTFSLSPVTHYGFDEKQFRKTYSYEQITSNLQIC